MPQAVPVHPMPDSILWHHVLNHPVQYGHSLSFKTISRYTGSMNRLVLCTYTLLSAMKNLSSDCYIQLLSVSTNESFLDSRILTPCLRLSILSSFTRKDLLEILLKIE